MTVTRGIPVIEVEVQLDQLPPPQGDPWNNYVACRYAWNDESSDLYSWQNESRQQVVRSRIVAPMVLHNDQHETQTLILSGGNPWFQRIGMRRIDNLLVVAGERCRRFRFGVGVNLPYPCQSAMSRLACEVRFPWPGEATASQAWIFHLNCKNVVALRWLPVEDGAGLRVLLKETEGRRVDLTLRCFRKISKARIQKMSGELRRDLVPQEHQVEMPLSAYEMIELTLFW